jgi:hypothetical protein
VAVGDNVYSPDVRGVAAGVCSVSATVDGVGSNAVTVAVR